MFGWDLEANAWSKFWNCLIKICVTTRDMNSTLGSVVPLAMFSSCFLLTTKQDLVVPYHIHGKIWPHCTRFWLGMLGSSSILWATFFGTTCIPPSNLKGEVALEFNNLKWYNAPSWLEHGICFPSTILDKTCSIPFSTGAGLFKAGPAKLERDNHRSLLHHCHSLHCGAEVYNPKTNK